MEVMARDLGCEVENCGSTAVDSGEGDGFGTGALRLARAADMRVRLDSAGYDYLAGCVDALVCFEVDAAGIGDGDYFLAVDGDVEVADAPRGYCLTSVNDDVNH